MKVLYIGADSQATGAGFSMLKLIEEEKKLGIDVVPVVHKGYTQELLRKKGEKHYIVNSWSWMVSTSDSAVKVFFYRLLKSILNVPCYFRYKRIIRKEKPDLVHVNALTIYSCSQAAVTCRIPIVWHIRELMEEDLNGRFWNKGQADRLMKKATYFIAISNCVKKKYVNVVGKDKIKCIYNGVDKDLFYRKEHTIFDNNVTNITMVGRITREKGQKDCLEALIPLLRENSNVVLRFVGEGSDEIVSELYKIKRESGVNDSQVQFMGFIREVDKIWGETDIAVVYSKCEAFGRVTIEAKMAGALVVGYDSGGTSELIEDGVDGYLFDGEKRTLLDVIEKALSNIEVSRRIAETGREKAAHTFTSERNARLVFGVYEEVLKKL